MISFDLDVAFFIFDTYIPTIYDYDSVKIFVFMGFYLDIMVTIVTKRFYVKYNGCNDKRYESNEMSPNVTSFGVNPVNRVGKRENEGVTSQIM